MALAGQTEGAYVAFGGFATCGKGEFLKTSGCSYLRYLCPCWGDRMRNVPVPTHAPTRIGCSNLLWATAVLRSYLDSCCLVADIV